ncbi:MAG: InlB B-repeat-containing protein [Clostridia bacterium]|nr:InlB B-repeat-containing protein [Clostridia bacterium]
MKNTCLRRMLLLMMAALCLIPAMALAMPDIMNGEVGDDYSWDETKNLLTVTGEDVYVDTSADNAAFDINVQSGSLHVIGHVVGDVTVKDGNLSIIHDNYGVNLAALTGGLFVEGGEVFIRGYTPHGEGTATAGVRLTKNSTIIGGKVWIAGGNDMDDGSLALTRDGSVTLSVSEKAWLRLSGGVPLVEDERVTFRPDYNGQTSPALDEANLNMLVWESPVQMKAKNYKKVEDVVDEFEKAVFQDEATVYKPGDMKGKNVIESFKGWVVSYNANGGTGFMEGAIVPDGSPYTVATDCEFTAPAGHSFAHSWLVNDDTMKEFSFPVTADVTIKPVWKVNQYTLKFVDEDGDEMHSITADYGTPITTVPSIPEREGYTFAGWDGEIPQTMPARDVTLTAKWTKQETLYRVSKKDIENADHTNLPYKTTDELKDALRQALADMGFVAEGELFYDVILEKSEDGGETWEEVPADEFPKSGFQVVFKYPAGTNKDDFVFKVVHMFTITDNNLNIKAGDMEIPAVTQMDEGVMVTLTGLSPVLLQWQPKASADSLPQTGDPSSLLGWAALLGASSLGAKALRRRKK